MENQEAEKIVCHLGIQTKPFQKWIKIWKTGRKMAKS